MKRKTILIISILIISFSYGLSQFFNKGSLWSKPKQQATPVTVIRVETIKTSFSEELPGRVVAFNSSEVRPQVNGIITNRLFTEGSKVEEGQQLYQIEPTVYLDAYERAKANLQRSVANMKYLELKLKRYDKLIKTNTISEQAYEDTKVAFSQAKADVNINKAEVSQAKNNLEYTKVYAPICGHIGKSSVTKGALVTANQLEPLTKITQLDPVYVDMTQSSNKLMQIKEQLKGESILPVSLFINNFSGSTKYKHEGKLQFSEVTVNPNTGSVLLRAIFPNPEETLLPGMFVRAKVMFKEAEHILIPQQATVRSPDGVLNVWIVDSENKVTLKPIIANSAIGNKWLITDGLKSGDIIIIEGFQKIFPNATVMPVFEDTVLNKTPKDSTKNKDL